MCFLLFSEAVTVYGFKNLLGGSQMLFFGVFSREFHDVLVELIRHDCFTCLHRFFCTPRTGRICRDLRRSSERMNSFSTKKNFCFGQRRLDHASGTFDTCRACVVVNLTPPLNETFCSRAIVFSAGLSLTKIARD